ncbi:MAG: hypothetical protein ACQUHE_17525, partial [Bacteroidia bacterium]
MKNLSFAGNSAKHAPLFPFFSFGKFINFKKIVTFSVVLLFLFSIAESVKAVKTVPKARFAPTTLAQGDLSIIAYEINTTAASRKLAWVPWKDLEVGTVIKFSDNGFHSGGAANVSGNYRALEQIVTWTATSAVPAGTVVYILNESSVVNANTGTVVMINTGSTTPLTFWSIAQSGDEIFAYQSSSDPANATNGTFSGTILFGLGYQGQSTTFTNWVTSGTITTNSSYLPSDLTSGNHVFIGNSYTAAQYNGSRTGLTIAQYRASIANSANWTGTTGANTSISVTTTGFGVPVAVAANYEFFEGATANAKTVTNSTTGLNFTLGNKLAVQNYAGYGVQAANSPSATVGSNFYVGNDGNTGTGQVNSITSTNKALFTVKSLWVYPSSNAIGSPPTNNGSITFRGKKNGVQQFTFTKSTGFQTAVQLGTNYNGFTLVDFSSGTDNSTTLIDELEITLGGSFQYLAMDNFAFTATPGITNTAATSLTSTSATLNSGVNPSASAVSAISFDYSTSSTLASGVTNVAATPATLVSGNTSTAVSANISSLAASTTYYYRAKATNSIGTNDNSTILSFTTSAPSGSAITSATYNASTGVLGVTATGLATG